MGDVVFEVVIVCVCSCQCGAGMCEEFSQSLYRMASLQSMLPVRWDTPR